MAADNNTTTATNGRDMMLSTGLCRSGYRWDLLLMRLTCLPAQWLSGIVAGFFTEKSAGDDDHQDIKQEEPFSSKKQERRSPMLMK